jgi:adenosylcobyric acid synthase
MIQGTASNVGKSIITTALCRLIYKKGYKVSPFKSQNMALNSYITKDGLEMGRAQVVQAEACGIAPQVYMNPILLKPTGNSKSQVIVNGKVLENMGSIGYSKYKNSLREKIMENYNFIRDNYDVSIIEGAGSPVEINMNKDDIVNMGMAKMANSPVILVADIDRGGVFASIVGTMTLFTEEERARVKGVIINKFRGDVKLLQSGLVQLEELIGVPVLGVVPYAELNIEDEDGITERFKKVNEDKDIKISVIKLKHMSNFTDMDAFNLYNDVSINYVTSPEELGDEDMIIIPGSKSTISDLLTLKENGIAEKITKLAKKGTIIFGICGGYQMLGEKIEDPKKIEGDIDEIPGLGLLELTTVMESSKNTLQYSGEILVGDGLFKGLSGSYINGYEIHQGVTNGNENGKFLDGSGYINGVIKDNIIGCYIHGIFDNSEFTRGFLNNIRNKKGLDSIDTTITFDQFKENEYDKLAKIVKESVDMKKIYNIMGLSH